MPGKYRPIGVAEKRAMLEAAGEEWPIGSDGLPMCWEPYSDRLSGGVWRVRSERREKTRKWRANDPFYALRLARVKERNAANSAVAIPFSTACNRRKAIERDQKKIDELMKLLPSDIKELLNV